MIFDNDNRGGPVDSEASYFRDYGIVMYSMRKGVTCHQCNSGEVYSPMQAMDGGPEILNCLNCGATDESPKFNKVKWDKNE